MYSPEEKYFYHRGTENTEVQWIGFLCVLISGEIFAVQV